MGKFLTFFISLIGVSAAFGQYYQVSVRTIADKTNYPEATFMIEEGSSQMKGFEGSINTIGFGGEGLKPISLVEKEYKEKLNLEMEEKLAVPVQDKLEGKLLRLEMAMKNLELKLSSKEREQANSSDRGRMGRNSSSKNDGSMRPPPSKNYRYMEAYSKAKSEYEKFKQDFERAKRNLNVRESLVKEIDEDIKEYYDKLLAIPVANDGAYPFGTFTQVAIQKVDGGKVKFDFDYAICRILGWVGTEGNNNNNIMNSCLDLEYIEMPSKKGVIAELDKPYCFQIARPEKEIGSLREAQNKTSIFATNPGASDGIGEGEAAKTPSNPLNADGNFTDIRSKFKGREKEVIRVIVTISKS